MNPSTGGPCQGIRNIVPELKKLGVHNEVVCLDDPTDSFLGKDPFVIHAIGPSVMKWQYNRNLVPWLMEHLSRFDIIIVHALWLYHGFATKQALQQYRKALVSSGKNVMVPRLFVMPHGMLDPYFQKASERKIKALRNWAYWKFIESKVVNDAEGLLFTCNTELLLARESFTPYHPKKELNIGYGVQSPPLFETGMMTAFFETCAAVKDAPYIVFLGRIHKKKGIDHLIEAYAKLCEKNQENKNFSARGSILPKLVIAGPGLDTAYGQKIQQLVSASVNLRESVFFPGMLKGDAKWGAFYGSQAFILPSHQENFGIAVVEALACGKPVLISNQVNIWREILDAGAGKVADDTIEGTQNLLESWLQLSSEERRAMGERAKNSFASNFSIQPAAKRFCESLYLKVTAEN